MKLDYDSFPLDIFKDDDSKSFLRTIEKDLKQPSGELSEAEKTVISFISKLISLELGAFGVSLATTISSLSMMRKGRKANDCISDIIKERLSRIKDNNTDFLVEAQLNLMTTYCVTSYLSVVECGYLSTGINDLARVICSPIMHLDLKRLFTEKYIIAEEREKKYDDICIVYYIAFLLWGYKANTQNRDLIKDLIKEVLCEDEDGVSLLSSKKLPILFSENEDKTLYDAMKYGIYYVFQETRHLEELRNTFIEPYMKEFKEELGEI